jgi:hypothetical protein
VKLAFYFYERGRLRKNKVAVAITITASIAPIMMAVLSGKLLPPVGGIP